MTELAATLQESYGVHAAELHRIPAGTNTINYRVVDDDGRRWFAKIYRSNLGRRAVRESPPPGRSRDARTAA